MIVSRWLRRAAVLMVAVAVLVLTPTYAVAWQSSLRPEHSGQAVRVGPQTLVGSSYERQQPTGIRITVAALGEALGKRWNAFFKDWLKPARSVLLPWLAVLIVLLVIARLATAVVVATDAVSYQGWRIAIWWGGLLMVCAAATVPVGVSYARGEQGWWRQDVGAFWLGIVTGTAGLCLAWALNLARGNVDDLPRWKRLRLPVHRRPGLLAVSTLAVSLGAAVLFIVVGGRGWAITNLERATAGLWVLGVLLAAVGVVWVAVGRGQALKLQIDVRKKDGAADPNGAHYLMGRLQDLGSRRPHGLEAPEQTDVTALPDTALKTLPAGGVAVAIANALQLVRAAIPWHGTVSIVDDDTVVITLARNGRVAVDTRRIDRLATVPPPPADASKGSANGESDKSKDKQGDDGAQAQAELLTAAAAFFLWALAQRHPELREGLCGAEKWESIARLAIATPPSRRLDGATRERLLAAAVDSDPGNVLARVALLETRYRTAFELDAHHKLAEALDEQWKVIEDQLAKHGQAGDERARPDPGYGALQLRLLYSRAAVWLNIQLLEDERGQHGQDAWGRAHAAARWLVRRLGHVRAGKDKEEDPGLDEFADDLYATARFIWEGMVNRAEQGWENSAEGAAEITEIRKLTEDWGEDGLNRRARYVRACSLAGSREDKAAPGILEEALDELERAATDDGLRKLARNDPSFAVFRRLDLADGLRCRYKKVVGDEPLTDFLALPPFTRHAERLRARGITGATDLKRASTQDLARRLGVERSRVGRWQEIARLAEDPPGGGKLDIGILQVLLSLNIHSRAELRTQLRNPERLYERLVAKAVDLNIVPTRAETIHRWRRGPARRLLLR